MKKIKVLLGVFIISASLSGQTRSFGEKIEAGDYKFTPQQIADARRTENRIAARE